MSSKSLTIPISKLLLDQRNARLGEVQSDQENTVAALANKIGPQLLEIAQDIISSGLDPTNLPAVTPEDAPEGKYRVIEGNRRLLALKSLKDPSILRDADISSYSRKKLGELSRKFNVDPITRIPCVVFPREFDAYHWINLRHTGANNGVGLVEWDSNEKDRYRIRHGGLRNPAGQVIDFVDKFYPPEDGGKDKILTTINRLVSDPDVRAVLGIELSSQVVYSNFPAEEVIKGLAAVVGDLRAGSINVTSVYHKEPRLSYIRGFGQERVPDPAMRLEERIALIELEATRLDYPVNSAGSVNTNEVGKRQSANDSETAQIGLTGGDQGQNPPGGQARADSSENGPGGQLPENPGKGAVRSRAKPQSERSSTIPSNCHLWIPSGRINEIHYELLRLNVNDFTNACSVLLRVFVELSVDYHIAKHNVMTEQQRANTPLKKRLKELSEFLCSNGIIGDQLNKAMIKISDGASLGFSAVTFNQYVHNQFTYPKPSEVLTAWDELQPFLAELWKK
jgi:hypothetical protein